MFPMIAAPPNHNARSPMAATAPSRGDWWRHLFEASSDAQVVCDTGGCVKEVNQKAAHLLNLNHAILPPGCHISEMLTEGVARKLTSFLRSPSGREEILLSVNLLCGGQLGLVADLHVTALSEGYSLLTIRDASRRWRMESHAQRLITAIDSTPDVVFLTNADLKLTFVNAAFQTVTGHNVEEVLGRTADFLRAPGEGPKIEQYLERVRQGLDWTGELLNVRQTGATYPVASAISPIYDKKGDFLGYAAIERDISTHKRLEQELRVERNYVLGIINSLESAVYTLDRDFCLSHVNEGWKKMPAEHGWLTIQEPPQAGRRLLDYAKDAAKREQLEIIFKTILADGQPQEIQATSSDKRHWLVKITPWRQENEMLGLIYVVTDQTKFYELQRQLFQAQKMETMGALAAGVAHDFNNLLLAIRGNVNLLQLEEPADEMTRHRLEQINLAATRAADITEQLLSFSRPSDKIEQIVDFNDVIREASQLAQRSMMSKIHLRLLPADAPLPVRLDNTRAQQLLLNLCVNAQDAMPEGGRLTITNATLSLSPEQAAKTSHPAGAPFVCCSVADTGTGIPAEILPRIFDPFFTTKQPGKGTGLGLAIVHSIVARAGGFLEIESVLGQGTTFHICLPTAQGRITQSSKSVSTALRKGSGRVLVVDDLDLVLDFTCGLLKEAGYDVLVASNAEEALDVLENEPLPVDLLFTDYNMSGMNGWELIQEVAVKWPRMKFVLVSGYVNDEERQIIEQDGRAGILRKPFNLREATHLIAELLASSR